MTLDQLAALQAVAELGSIKAASTTLHKTQPAISQSLKQLEKQINIQLFDRSNYRLELTQHGKRIYQQAKRVLTEANELLNLAHHLSTGNESSVTLAVDGSYELPKLLPVFEDAQKTFPDTELHLSLEYLTGALEAVTSGKADIAITPLTVDMLAEQALEATQLNHLRLVNVASPALIAKSDSNLAAFRHAYQIVVRDSGQLSGTREYGVQDGQRKWYVYDLATKKTLIMSGMGWGRLPEHMIHEELASGRVQELHLKSDLTAIETDQYLLRAHKQNHGPVANYLWNKILKLYESSEKSGQRRLG